MTWLGAAVVLALAPWGQTQTSSATETARESALFGDEDSDREADLFGDDGDGIESALFGQTDSSSVTTAAPQSSTGDRLFSALSDNDDYLDIGGVAWFWMQAFGREKTEFQHTPLSAPSFVDVYMDARPNDRVRAYIRGRLNYDPTIDEAALGVTGATQSQTRARLDQLWVKFDILRTAFLTLGQQRVRWGTGRIWNPTDFLNDTRIDSLNFLDTRLGVPLVKVHVPVESLGWNFYAMANFDGASTMKEVGAGLRGEVLIGPAEVALSTAIQKGEPWRLGADISLPVWEFDLRIEAALLNDVQRPFFDSRSDATALQALDRVTADELNLLLDGLRGVPIDRSDDWISQVVVGVDYAVRYNDDDTLLLSLEYFYNDGGTDAPEAYLPMFFNGAFEALYVGRHYVALAAYLVAPGDWDDTTFSLISLANISDRTGLVRLNYSLRVLTFLRLNAFASVQMGRRGGEFRFALKVPPVDSDLVDLATTLPAGLSEAFKAGFDVQPTIWQAGATLVLDF